MTIYSLDILHFLFGTSPLFHVQFLLLLPDVHADFSRSRSGGLVFPSLSEFSTVYCDPHSQSFGIVNKAEIDVFLELSCFFHGKDKKAFFSDQCKEIEENNRMEKARDRSKKIRVTKGKFDAKMGSIKDRNGKDLTSRIY